ncbi:MAG: hypothetical protein VW258_09410 [Thalassolituus sp.]
MNVVDDLETVLDIATEFPAFTVQKEFFRDTPVGNEPIFLIRSEGGAVSNTLEAQPVSIMLVQQSNEDINVKDIRTLMEQIKVTIMQYDYRGGPSGLYNIDIVGGILPVQMKDGRKGYTMNLIARYGRTEAIL